MPLAFPEMILDLNLTLMFGMLMVMIYGFIGTACLSQKISRALSFTDGGKGLVIGFCISVIELTADQFLVKWTQQKKIQIGFEHKVCRTDETWLILD